MKESSKPGQLFYSAIFVFGILTAFNMFLSIREPGWLALIFFGLATGAIGVTVVMEALEHYGAADDRKLSGRTRRKMAFVSGVVFGAAMTPAFAIVKGIDGDFAYFVGLVVGSSLSGRVRRALTRLMSIRTASPGGQSDNTEGEHDFRMPRFANDSTREQLAAGAVMVLGFALSAGVALAVYAGLLATVGR